MGINRPIDVIFQCNYYDYVNLFRKGKRSFLMRQMEAINQTDAYHK